MKKINEGYCALLVSIIKHCSPEQAFKALSTGKIERNIDDALHFRELKKEYTYDQIAEMCCMGKYEVYYWAYKYFKDKGLKQ